MPKKKTEHYVNNRELLEAMIVYREKVNVAREKFIKKYDKEPINIISNHFEVAKRESKTYIDLLDKNEIKEIYKMYGVKK